MALGLAKWPQLSCSGIAAPSLPGAKILQIEAADVRNFSFPSTPPTVPEAITGLDFCNITVKLTHNGASDTVYVNVWLPSSQWNGRYQAAGGGGFAADAGASSLVGPVASGWAASSTDAGLTLDRTIDPQTAKWAVNPDGSPNKDLQLNLAWRSIHDMAEISKSVIQQYYGKKPSYSYWQGCSQGGRQGYAAASKYPKDFDGILANAPALDLARYGPAAYWSPTVMRSSGVIPPFCVLEEYQKALIQKCDPLDGVVDGLISDHRLLEHCPFDPASLVGKSIVCSNGCTASDPKTVPATSESCNITITAAYAEVVTKILEGPKTRNGKQLWPGIEPGASFSPLAGTAVGEDGVRHATSFFFSDLWMQFFVKRNGSYDVTKIRYDDLYKIYDASVAQTGPLFGIEALDLSGFKAAGGKLMTWAGMADQTLNPVHLLAYRDKVEIQLGGSHAVDKFYRVFLAPGVDHCSGGVGPNPVNPIDALVSWVEKGQAPDTIPASTTRSDGVKVTRNLCYYPQRLVYRGGDVNKASSFTCK